MKKTTTAATTETKQVKISMNQVDGVKRHDMYKIDPRVITVQENWNPRQYFDAEKLEELKNSIIENGVQVPVRVKLQGDKIILLDGERRLRATLMAIEEGNDIQTIPAISERKTMKPTDMLLLALTTNTGENLTVMEEARAILKLTNWGMNVLDIAKKLGKTPATIYGRIKLMDADEEVIDALDAGEITQTEAKKIVSTSDGTKEDQKKKMKEIKVKKTIKKTSKKECVELLDECIEWLVELSKDQKLPQVDNLIQRITEVSDE